MNDDTSQRFNPDEQRRIAKIRTDRNAEFSHNAAKALHIGICNAMGVRPSADGVKAEICRVLDIRLQRYTQATSGTRGSLPTVMHWVTLWNNSEVRKERGYDMLRLIWNGEDFLCTPLAMRG